MMWNPIVTSRLLPGEAIPAAKAAHGAEAVLAVLAIIIWHFYNVHIKHLNKSMFTGKMTEEEMAEEHPAELEEIKTRPAVEIPPDVLRKRQRVFLPIAVVLALIFGTGLFLFVTIETTAITTVLPGESAQVYVPATPTTPATPTAIITPTSDKGVALNSWDGTYAALFRNRCSTCHGTTAVGGLSLSTYQQALAGGNTGPGIVPGKPDESLVVKYERQGGHPGQLTAAELQQVIEWIQAGAPEK
jgi:mono/diheme cytochrome c family protein